MTDTNVAAATGDGTAAPPDGLTNEAIDAAIDPPEPSAEEKLRALEKELSEYKARTRAQEEMIGGLRSDLSETKKIAAELREAQRELVDSTREARTRGYEWTRADIEARMEAAVESGDVQTYRALRAQLYDLEQHRPASKPREETKPDKDKSEAPQIDPVAAKWVEENNWFSVDDEMHDYAVARESRYLKTIPDTATRLAKVKEEVVRRFPDKFDNPARRQAPAVAGPTGQVARQGKQTKTKTVADLPDDAKQALARIKRRDPSFKDEDYLNAYQWDK